MNQYEGKHRDDSPEADARNRVLDHDARWSRLYPCTHYHGRHSAYVCKVRAA